MNIAFNFCETGVDDNRRRCFLRQASLSFFSDASMLKAYWENRVSADREVKYLAAPFFRYVIARHWWQLAEAKAFVDAVWWIQMQMP